MIQKFASMDVKQLMVCFSVMVNVFVNNNLIFKDNFLFPSHRQNVSFVGIKALLENCLGCNANSYRKRYFMHTWD